MTELYWHRWDTGRGLVFLLFNFPQNHSDDIRSLGELAIVRSFRDTKAKLRWRYDVSQIGSHASTWGFVGGPQRARRLAQEAVNKAL